METERHQRLKQLAVRLIRQWGGPAVACEVRCPRSRYRVDVAGYVDRLPRGNSDGNGSPASMRSSRRSSQTRSPITVLVECKQSRQDFLRDCEELERLLHQRRKLDHFRQTLERDRIRHEEPHLRQVGEHLFPDMEAWDFHRSELPAYRRVLTRLKRLDERLHGQTKFCMMARYRLADYLYLAAPAGMIRPRELPPCWGLLECPRKWLSSDEEPSLFDKPHMLRVAVRAQPLNPPADQRLRLLRNIAVTACWGAAPDFVARSAAVHI